MSNVTKISVSEIPGICLKEEFITQEEEAKLLQDMDKPIDSSLSTPWTTDVASRKTQQFGYKFNYFNGELNKMERDIPEYLNDLLERIQPFHKSEKIEQIIMNEYSGKDQYIKKHVDSLYFGSIVSILSLSQPCVMILYELSEDGKVVDNNNNNNNTSEDKQKEIDITIPIRDLKTTGRRSGLILQPRSLLILSGMARYRWKHEIISLQDYSKHGFDIKQVIGDNNNLDEYRRVSITMRSIAQNKNV
ncbi:hypothetical protein ABK040_014069 [Willaertia magna]